MEYCHAVNRLAKVNSGIRANAEMATPFVSWIY